MGTEFIPNVGNIDLPDGLTDEQKVEAVNSHPLVQKYLQNQGKNQNTYQKLDQYLTNTFGPINNAIKNNSFLNNADQFSHQIGKGIPVAGHFLPDTDEQKQFAQDHPLAASIAHGVGGAVALGPASEALALKAAQPVASTVDLGAQTGAKSFEGILTPPSGYQALNPATKNTISQAGLFGGTTAADDLSQGKGLEDTGKDAVLSAVGGAVGGPIASKIASPGIKLPDWLAKAATGLTGAVTGLHYGPMEALLGLIGGRSHGAPEILQKVIGNKAFKNPENQAILNILASEGAKQGGATAINGPMVPNGE